MKREDFIKIKENFGTSTPAAPRRHRGAKFIIEESLLEQNPPPIIGVSARAKGKQKAISPPPSSEKMRRGGNSLFIMVKKFLTLNNIYPLEMNWCYRCISRVIAWVYNNDEPACVHTSLWIRCQYCEEMIINPIISKLIDIKKWYLLNNSKLLNGKIGVITKLNIKIEVNILTLINW